MTEVESPLIQIPLTERPSLGLGLALSPGDWELPGLPNTMKSGHGRFQVPNLTEVDMHAHGAEEAGGLRALD